uniref:glutathione transferase n=1 Tax=Meloidogyne incognita TaxID=6306 RepID=A0A914KML6_MELIC
MVQYKLYYFDLRGLGEAIRLCFHYAGETFEDTRFTAENWPNEKNKFFYGKVPVLEVDGKQLSQSGAILQYLSNKFGLAGKDDWEKAKIVEIFDFYKDVYNELAPYIYAKWGIREGDVDKLRKDVFIPGAERVFPLFVKLLAESGSGFFVKSGLTYVDFVLAEYFELVRSFEPEIVGKYKELTDFVDKVYAEPKLKTYLSTRKTT